MRVEEQQARNCRAPGKTIENEKEMANSVRIRNFLVSSPLLTGTRRDYVSRTGSGRPVNETTGQGFDGGEHMLIRALLEGEDENGAGTCHRA